MDEIKPPYHAMVPKESRDIYVVDASGNELARILTPFGELSDDAAWEVRKNIANELAAASDMRQALERVYQELSDKEDWGDDLSVAAIEMIHTSLLKARGGQQ